MANIIEMVFSDPYIIKQLKLDPSMLTYFTNKPPVRVTQKDLEAQKNIIETYYKDKKARNQIASKRNAANNEKQLQRNLTLSRTGSTSHGSQFNGPEVHAAAAAAAAAAVVPKPLTPRSPKLPSGNAGRNSRCPKGSSCAVMGGRRTRRAKSRRTKSRRARRS